MANTSSAPVPSKGSFITSAKAWGDSSAPPTVLAALILAQHLHPPRVLPLLFPPALLFSSYLSVNGHHTDAAGTSAAWSGLYLLLARRRKQALMQKWSTRGIVRGATMGLCVINVAGGAAAYLLGRRSREPHDEVVSST